MRRILFHIALAALALAAAGTAMAWSVSPAMREQAWADSDGQTLKLSALRSPLIVMTMAYTACRKVCGTTTLVLADLQQRLDALQIEADIVVVSYDPDNDSPAQWREYRARRKLDRANWHFLSGDVRSTRAVARGLDLDFWNYEDHVVHDFRIVLFDAHWQPLAEIDWARTREVDRILAPIAGALRGAKPPQ